MHLLQLTVIILVCCATLTLQSGRVHTERKVAIAYIGTYKVLHGILSGQTREEVFLAQFLHRDSNVTSRYHEVGNNETLGLHIHPFLLLDTTQHLEHTNHSFIPLGFPPERVRYFNASHIEQHFPVLGRSFQNNNAYSAVSFFYIFGQELVQKHGFDVVYLQEVDLVPVWDPWSEVIEALERMHYGIGEENNTLSIDTIVQPMSLHKLSTWRQRNLGRGVSTHLRTFMGPYYVFNFARHNARAIDYIYGELASGTRGHIEFIVPAMCHRHPHCVMLSLNPLSPQYRIFPSFSVNEVRKAMRNTKEAACQGRLTVRCCEEYSYALGSNAHHKTVQGARCGARNMDNNLFLHPLKPAKNIPKAQASGWGKEGEDEQMAGMELLMKVTEQMGRENDELDVTSLSLESGEEGGEEGEGEGEEEGEKLGWGAGAGAEEEGEEERKEELEGEGDGDKE